MSNTLYLILLAKSMRFFTFSLISILIVNGKPRPLGRGYLTMWGFSDTFINPDFVSVLYSGWCPREGVYFPHR
jgi:hypothetical protein